MGAAGIFLLSSTENCHQAAALLFLPCLNPQTLARVSQLSAHQLFLMQVGG